MLLAAVLVPIDLQLKAVKAVVAADSGEGWVQMVAADSGVGWVQMVAAVEPADSVAVLDEIAVPS